MLPPGAPPLAIRLPVAREAPLEGPLEDKLEGELEDELEANLEEEASAMATSARGMPVVADRRARKEASGLARETLLVRRSSRRAPLSGGALVGVGVETRADGWESADQPCTVRARSLI